ncbi:MULTISPECIES: alpha/beta fold hydrolase [Streptomyces]|uniref:Alpha/beta hydrolase n=1 Tax=Streptomyces tricolor TaxID=68277 RepID=A0ABS9JMA5_9ACTN|nr:MULTISPECIES: alpha/beta fold hydrolase [Streptomyces]MCG0066629.1 alpha/beta hydrolase [Streptomyces tricolor]BCM70322.1 putative hydrolase [Streptomyces sp. EAS-AB2608]
MTDTLHYDVTGRGPVLLLVPGGAGHPMGLGPLTERLARRFTVVTYDPLGLAHGRLGRPVAEQRVADWSEGARRVLAEVLPGGASASVCGTSSGALAVLDLLARYPERLAHVVAHEPPCVTVLPDGAARRAELIGRLDGPERPPAEGESATPMGVFLARVLRPFTTYTPAAPPAPDRLTIAAGADSRGQLLYRTAESLAGRLGCGFAEFPGGHLGALDHPEEFADALAEALRSSARTSA